MKFKALHAFSKACVIYAFGTFAKDTLSTYSNISLLAVTLQ